MKNWQAQDMVALLREARHDFLNYLQVISGYLDLSMVEQAAEYVKKAAANLDRERTAFLAASPEVGLACYKLLVYLRQQGILVEFKEIEVQDAELLYECADVLSGMISGAGYEGDSNGDCAVVVSLSQRGDSLEIEVVPDGGGDVIRFAVHHDSPDVLEG